MTYAAEYDLAVGTTSLDNSIVYRANRRAYYSEGVQSVLNWKTAFAGIDHELTIGARVHQDEEDRFQEEDAYRLEGGRLVLTTAGAAGSQANRISSGEALAIFVQDKFTVGRLSVTGGARFEDYELTREDYSTSDPTRAAGPTQVRELSDTVVVPGLSALYQISETTTLLAGVHRGFAIASPGTTDADVEESVNWEFGGRYSRGEFELEAIAYFNDYSNLLGTCTASSGGGCTVGDQFNGGEVDVQGLEVTASWDAGSALNTDLSIPLSLVYTLTDAEFQTSFESDYEPWGDVVVGSLSGNYVSDARARAGQGSIPERELIEARWVADMAVWVDLTDRIRVRAKAENLFDEVYVASIDPAGLRPGKPFEFLMGVEVSF